MKEFDPRCILDLERRPGSEVVEADGIPTIDLYLLIDSEHDPKSLEALVIQIGEACKNWGFFQVINHGVPPDIRQNIDSFSRKLFSMSRDEKIKVSTNQLTQLGYYESEFTKNVMDWKEGFSSVALEPVIMAASPDPNDEELVEIFNQWPENLPGMRETCMEYGREMEKLAHKLLELIALSLGLARDRFHEFFKDQTTHLLLNHYPPCPVADLVLGANSHKDSGVLTILAVDDVPGLQVKRKKDGQWLFVKPVSDTYIINVADVLQVWSNDKYESVEHRVKVNSERERFSIPFFFNTSHYTMVQPLEELVDDDNPPKYIAYKWGKFYAARNLNYFKITNEIAEVSQFKTR